MKAVVQRSRGVSARLNGGVGFLMKKNKIDVIWGEAKLVNAASGSNPVEISVGKSSKQPMQPQNPVPKGVLGEGSYKAKHVIVATGARPRSLPGIEPDGKLIWTYFEAMVPQELPKSMLVMGSGAIGIEFASFYNDMGVDVTVVELMPQIMPVEDAEISALARKQLEKRGLKIITDAKVTKVEKGANNVTAHIETKDGKTQSLTVDRMISAVGVQGNIENLGLEALGVKPTVDALSSTVMARPMLRASMLSATLPARLCLHTKLSMKELSVSRRLPVFRMCIRSKRT